MKARTILATLVLSMISGSPLVFAADVVAADKTINTFVSDGGRDGSIEVWTDIISTVKQCTGPSEQGLLISICENRIYPTDDGVLVVVGNNDTYFLDLMINANQTDKKVYDLSFSTRSGAIVAEQYGVDLTVEGIFEALVR